MWKNAVRLQGLEAPRYGSSNELIIPRWGAEAIKRIAVVFTARHKEEYHAENKKGFTLIELLIVWHHRHPRGHRHAAV